MRATRSFVILNISSDFIMRRNLTIAIKRELLRKARFLAAERDASISHLLSDELERLFSQEEAYTQASNAAFAEIDRGLRLDGQPGSRTSLHQREIFHRHEYTSLCISSRCGSEA